MPTRCRYFAGPPSLNLTHHICQVKVTVRMPTSPLAHYLNGLNRRQRYIAQKGDQLGDRGNTKDLNALNEFGLSSLPQRHDHPGEAGLLRRQSGGQNTPDGREATIQPQLTQKDSSA